MKEGPVNRQTLARNPLFAGLGEAETGALLRILKGTVRAYEKGSIPHQAGTPMERFGLVLSGRVQACMDDLDGNRMILAEVAPGVTFGESLSFLKIPDAPVYIYASEGAEVLWLSPEALFTDLPDPLLPELRRRFMTLLARRTLDMNQRIRVLSQLTMREKLMAYLTGLAAQQGSRTVTLPLSREDTAVYIGANRSALSRELGRMQRDGLITVRRRQIELR